MVEVGVSASIVITPTNHILEVVLRAMLLTSHILSFLFFFQVVKKMREKLEYYARQQKTPSNMERDPQAYPEHHNGTWYYWEPNVTRPRFNETVIHAASRWFRQRS